MKPAHLLCCGLLIPLLAYAALGVLVVWWLIR